MAGIVMFGKNSNIGPSPGLWGLAPRDVLYDPAVAYGPPDPVQHCQNVADGAEANIGSGWNGFGSGGAAAVSGPLQTILGGVYGLGSDLADEGASISGADAPFKLSKLSEELFFECSITTSVTTTTHNSWFCGFVDAGALTAILPIVAGGTLATTINLVGFHSPEGASLTIDSTYQANGVTIVKVKDTVSAQAAGTYVKLGMHLKKGLLRFFVNGIPQADTKVVPDDTGTDFPADIQMRPCVAMLHGAGATGVVSIKFLLARQLRA